MSEHNYAPVGDGSLADEYGNVIPSGRGPWHSAEPPYGNLVMANRDAGNHWFEPDTMRFFRTRICDGGTMHGGRFFVTSERNTGPGYDYPRLYSVRVGNDDGTIGTMGEFQQYASRSGAIAAAKRYAAMLTPDAFDCPYCGRGITEHRGSAFTANGRDVERFERIHRSR